MDLRRTTPVALVAVGVVLAVALVGWQPERADPRASARPAPPAVRTSTRALEVLREWDARRASAWRHGDPDGLAALYTPGSRSGRHDRVLLAAYADRGLRVTGLRMQVLRLTVRSWGPDRIVVQVTDRLAGAVAVRRDARIDLPADRPSTRLVALARVAGEWRVAEVRQASPVASPVDSTASTSRSRKS